MSIRCDGDVIRVEGDCHVEQAEDLVRLIQDHPSAALDLTACRHLHSAVAQVVLSFTRRVAGRPTEPFLRDLVAPNFERLDDRGSS